MSANNLCKQFGPIFLSGQIRIQTICKIRMSADDNSRQLNTVHYSNFNMDHFTSILFSAKGWCFALISTKYAKLIGIASSSRLKCRSHTGWSSVCMFVGKCKIFFYGKLHSFQMVITCISYELQTGVNLILKG